MQVSISINDKQIHFVIKIHFWFKIAEADLIIIQIELLLAILLFAHFIKLLLTKQLSEM